MSDRTSATFADRRPERPIRFGFVGCGDVTEVKSGPAFALAGATVSAVMRRDGAKAADYARRHGVPRWTDDARDLIFADDVDAVYVATPPSSHAAYVHMAAEAGKPVYVEKPVARTEAEARAMLEACTAAGVPLFVAYYRRALPRFERVRTLIEEGAIGAPRTVSARLAVPTPTDRSGWRFDPEVAGGGLFMDLGSHVLDLLDHWLGPVAEAQGHVAVRAPGGRVEDEVSARLVFASGVHGVLLASFDGVSEVDEVRVFGERGSVRVPVFADGPVVIEGPDGAERSESIPHPKHVHEPLVRRMVEELEGRGGFCASTGVSAVRTQAVLDAILHGSRRRPA